MFPLHVGCPWASRRPIEFPAISRAAFELRMPFRAVLVDETISALWAQTFAAQAETAELTPSLRIALSSARYLQDPFSETCHALATDALSLSDLPLHPLMPSLPDEPLARALTAELVELSLIHI